MNRARNRSLSAKTTMLIAILMLLLLGVSITSNLHSISIVRTQTVSNNTNLIRLYFCRIDSE